MANRKKELKRKAIQTVKFLVKNSVNTYFVHYSCEDIDKTESYLSPRITSIAILHYASMRHISFSLHLSAEELGFSIKNINEHLDDIEKDMLIKFNEFLRVHLDNTFWIHWNMSYSTYGFEALAHRYKVLVNSNMVEIPTSNRYNLSELLSERYGTNYARDPKMPSLMKLNGGYDWKYLSGEDEILAFKAGEYNKLHQSIISKVKFFMEVLDKVSDNRLHTETNKFKFYLDKLYRKTWVQLLGIIGIFISSITEISNFVKFLQRFLCK